MSKVHLNRAKSVHDDEFYTPAEIVDKIIDAYRESLRGKSVYCPCDSEKSQFWLRLKNRFAELGLNRLIATSYVKDGHGLKLEYDGRDTLRSEMESDGSFMSDESQRLFGENDFIMTNPPFSRMAAFLKSLYEHEAGFAFVHSPTNPSKAYFARLISEKRIHPSNIGRFSIRSAVSDRIATCYVSSSFTDNVKVFSHSAKFEEHEYERFDECPECINVNRCKEIPLDYDGIMGVPGTAYMEGFFESGYVLLGLLNCAVPNPPEKLPEQFDWNNKYPFSPYVNGEIKFSRLLVRKDNA